MAEKVKISPKVVRNQIENEGMTRTQLAAHYGISSAQINKFLKMTNMSDLRPKKIMFEIEEDDVQTLQPSAPIIMIEDLIEDGQQPVFIEEMMIAKEIERAFEEPIILEAEVINEVIENKKPENIWA